MITRDLFVHMGETLNIPVQLLDTMGNPIAVDDYTVQFATALEFATDTIEILSSANTDQISVSNTALAIVNVALTPSSNSGYMETNHVYQMRTVNNDTNAVTVYLEGKLFVKPSLFD